MAYYCSFGDLQNELRSYYHRTGERLQFLEAVDRLYSKGILVNERPVSPTSFDAGSISVEEFENYTDGLYFCVSPTMSMHSRVSESDMIPELDDGFIIRHPRYTRPYLHRHDYVEINYVVTGSCIWYFEEEVHTLNQGDLVIIGPSSLHDIEILDESVVYCLMLRRSTFQSAFFSLISRDDVLSAFFRKMLTDDGAPNYLLLHAEDEPFVRIMLQCMMQECHNSDMYSNYCCISLVNLMFANLLRSGDDEPVFYHYQMGPDFSGVLHYIRHNYRTLTLSELADHFHYSKPHMCTLIKQNTGVNFSALIRQVRMNEAAKYLTRTDFSISDIAELTGYNSSDNFSRVFRKTYGMSPVEYRKENTPDDGRFVPFKMQ